MIALNDINLSKIDLSGIDLRGIKLGIGGRGGSGDDSQRPWLFPDQAWTVTGKTNEDSNRDIIANVTGNGNNLMLTNFGFAEGSGYGLYAENYNKWYQVSARGDFIATADKINITAVKETTSTLIYKRGEHLKQRIRVSGLPEGVNLVIGRQLHDFYIIAEDGTYNIDVIDNSGVDPYTIGYKISKVLESCDITIEQIPEYEGYLITDGVNDKVVSSAFETGKDFTVVGEWKFMNDVTANADIPKAPSLDSPMDNAGIVKKASLYVLNINNELKILINNPDKGPVLNTKTLKAICSDGRVYFDDWSEMLISEEQFITSSDDRLLIGCNVNKFTRIALKNLAIYNHILSKDDCIKAYDYLQTLKAK